MRRFKLTKPHLLCAGYVLAHTLSHFSARWFEVLPGVSTSIWYPPAGLAFALLMLLGPRYWPVVFLANFLTAWFGSSARPLWSALLFPGLVTASYATVAWMVRRWFGSRLLPGDNRETTVFYGTIIGAPLAVALAGMTMAAALRPADAPLSLAAFLRSTRDWWIGDASGLLTVVPAAVVFLGPWLEGRPVAPRNRPWRPGLALVQAVVLLGTLLLVIVVPELQPHRAFYLCFLPLVWVCIVHGLPGATIATLLVMIVGLLGMRLAGVSVSYSYVFLMFDVAVAGVGLGIGTMVSRRDEAEARLAAYNLELARLHRLETDEKFAAQLAEEKARLEVLRYQLNPHFLYNSLNSIYGLLFENVRGAAEMVLRLSEFCRATLTDAKDEFPTLGAEIETLRSYLDVEKVRWGEHLRITLEVEPEVARVRLPPFLLLPLVENAIKYGGRTSPALLELHLSAQPAFDRVRIAIANTGRWVEPGHAQPDSTGIGLDNLRQRLQRYYPDAHRFTLEAKDGWVTARLDLPASGPAHSLSARPPGETAPA